MEFKVGDSVVHPVYGLGQLVNIEEKQFTAMGSRLFYEIMLPTSTMWIPVETQETSGLRLATAGSDLDHYRDVLLSRPVPLHESYRQRQLDLISRLTKGSFQVVCEVVRDLTARGWGKTLSRTDAVTLKKTQTSLCLEWAAAAGVSVAEATTEVRSLLQPAQQAALG